MSSKLAHHIYRSICHQNLTDWPNVSKKDRKSTRLNSSHSQISYAVFCLKKKKDKRCKTDGSYYGIGLVRVCYPVVVKCGVSYFVVSFVDCCTILTVVSVQ